MMINDEKNEKIITIINYRRLLATFLVDLFLVATPAVDFDFDLLLYLELELGP